MNERIKELMLSKGLHKYISADCQHRMEVLAELIVRECANVVHTRIGPKSALDVLEHFGVEE